MATTANKEAPEDDEKIRTLSAPLEDEDVDGEEAADEAADAAEDNADDSDESTEDRHEATDDPTELAREIGGGTEITPLLVVLLLPPKPGVLVLVVKGIPVLRVP